MSDKRIANPFKHVIPTNVSDEVLELHIRIKELEDRVAKLEDRISYKATRMMGEHNGA